MKLAIGLIAALAVFLGVGTVSANPPGPAPNQTAGGQVEEGFALAVAFQACQAQNVGSRQVNQAVGPSIGGGLSLLNFRGAYHQQLANWQCTAGYFTALSAACEPITLVNNVTDEKTALTCEELAENAVWAASGVVYWRGVINSGLVGPSQGWSCARYAGGGTDVCFTSSNLPAGVTQAAVDAAVSAVLAAESGG